MAHVTVRDGRIGAGGHLLNSDGQSFTHNGTITVDCGGTVTGTISGNPVTFSLGSAYRRREAGRRVSPLPGSPAAAGWRCADGEGLPTHRPPVTDANGPGNGSPRRSAPSVSARRLRSDAASDALVAPAEQPHHPLQLPTMHPRAGAALSRAVLEQHRRQVFGHVSSARAARVTGTFSHQDRDRVPTGLRIDGQHGGAAAARWCASRLRHSTEAYACPPVIPK